MKRIPLTQGKYSLVDDRDYEWLMEMGPWYANDHTRGTWTAEMSGGLLMHRFILNAPKGMDVDHINGDSLDNQRANLRVCTHAENGRNIHKNNRNMSEYKGVRFKRDRKKYVARIKVNYKSIHLGYYETPDEAALAYNVAAKKYFGEYAWLNQVGQ